MYNNVMYMIVINVNVHLVYMHMHMYMYGTCVHIYDQGNLFTDHNNIITSMNVQNSTCVYANILFSTHKTPILLILCCMSNCC